MADLKPCRRCGGEKIDIAEMPNVEFREHIRRMRRDNYEFIYVIFCRACGATLPSMYKRQLLIDIWNGTSHRSPMPEIDTARIADGQIDSRMEADVPVWDLPRFRSKT